MSIRSFAVTWSDGPNSSRGPTLSIDCKLAESAIPECACVYVTNVPNFSGVFRNMSSNNIFESTSNVVTLLLVSKSVRVRRPSAYTSPSTLLSPYKPKTVDAMAGDLETRRPGRPVAGTTVNSYLNPQTDFQLVGPVGARSCQRRARSA